MIDDMSVPMAKENSSVSIGSRVREHRQKLNLSQADLASALGLNSPQIVSQIETGDRELKAKELVRISEILMTSIQNLLSNSPLEVPTARWRDRPENGFEKVEARLCLRCEEWCGERVYRDLPRLSFVKDRVPKIGEVERAADEIRIVMELGGRPASSLKDALEEDFGIKIFHDSFNGTALCVSGGFGQAILLNRDNVRGRRNFSLAHELYHLLVDGIYPQEAQNIEEKHAQIFASSLLLPSAPVIGLLDAKANDGKIPLRELVATAQDFHVSTEALLWRLCNLQRMDRDKAKTIIAGESLRWVEAHGMGKNKAPEDLPERYVRLAYEAHRLGKLGRNKLAQFLETSVSELDSDFEGWNADVSLDEETEIAFA
jgi:Zn-dependent peptidase ImmA (M78 family)/transcriptional regulator with XRE-family HTH domain